MTEKIGRIALFANITSGNQHPTTLLDLVTLDEAGRAPLDANGHRLITDPDSPISIYVHASLADAVPDPIPALLQELRLTIDDRDSFPLHRDEREQKTADAVTTLLEQAGDAAAANAALAHEIRRLQAAHAGTIQQAREWKAAAVNAHAEADAVSRTLEYRERRAAEAEREAAKRIAEIEPRERRAARSVEQAVNRSNHSNELVEKARAETAQHKAHARNAAEKLTAAKDELKAAEFRTGKIIDTAREWKRRALAAESRAEQRQQIPISVTVVDRDGKPLATHHHVVGYASHVTVITDQRDTAEISTVAGLNAILQRLGEFYPEPNVATRRAAVERHDELTGERDQLVHENSRLRTALRQRRGELDAIADAASLARGDDLVAGISKIVKLSEERLEALEQKQHALSVINETHAREHYQRSSANDTARQELAKRDSQIQRARTSLGSEFEHVSLPDAIDALLTQRNESRQEALTADNLLDAICEELTPGRRDKDLVLAARELKAQAQKFEIAHESVERSRVAAEDLDKRLRESERIVELRDRDIDQLKRDLTAARNERLEAQLAERGALAAESHAVAELAKFRTHLENVTERVLDESNIIQSATPRRGDAIRRSVQHLRSAANTARKELSREQLDRATVIKRASVTWPEFSPTSSFTRSRREILDQIESSSPISAVDHVSAPVIAPRRGVIHHKPF